MRISSPKANAKRIAEALIQTTGVSANTLVLTAPELDAAAAGNPFLDLMNDSSRMLVGFMIAGADYAQLQSLVDSSADEHVAMGANALYVWCPNGILDSAFAAKLVGPKFRDLVRHQPQLVHRTQIAGTRHSMTSDRDTRSRPRTAMQKPLCIRDILVPRQR